MPNSAFIVNTTIKNITRILCRIDDSQLQRIPSFGPLILVANHINFLEVPLIYTHLYPRPLTGFAKAETWNNPIYKPLFDLWGAIPIKRGEVDINAIRHALCALEKGMIIAIAPEGTRSGNGKLQQGHPGISLIALHSSAPLMPLAYFGGEKFKENITKLKKTDFKIRVGDTFRIKPYQGKVTKEIRQIITNEIMYQLAIILPQNYRGYYSDISQASSNHIYFEA